MLTEKDGKLWRRYDKELLCIEAYGVDSLRVRATQLRGFQDERLKRVAIILTDEIEQYLTLNKFLDHDTSVEFFNNKITSAGFVINPISLVEVGFESLCICKGRKI